MEKEAKKRACCAARHRDGAIRADLRYERKPSVHVAFTDSYIHFLSGLAQEVRLVKSEHKEITLEAAIPFSGRTHAAMSDAKAKGLQLRAIMLGIKGLESWLHHPT